MPKNTEKQKKNISWAQEGTAEGTRLWCSLRCGFHLRHWQLFEFSLPVLKQSAQTTDYHQHTDGYDIQKYITGGSAYDILPGQCLIIAHPMMVRINTFGILLARSLLDFGQCWEPRPISGADVHHCLTADLPSQALQGFASGNSGRYMDAFYTVLKIYKYMITTPLGA